MVNFSHLQPSVPFLKKNPKSQVFPSRKILTGRVL